MKNPVSLTIIALVVWIVGSSFVYVCTIRDHCFLATETEEATPQVTAPEPAGPDMEPAEPEPATEPEPAPDPVSEAKIYLDENGPQFIYFEFGNKQAGIPDEFPQYIDQLKVYLEGTPGSQVHVTGHTDLIGNSETNDRLSRQRAAFVADYLARQGIDRSAIVEEGKGDKEPVASNDTEEGRSKNRRVEVKITK